jgi:hypothetical protein
MVVRSWKNCGFWLLFSLLPVLILLLRGIGESRELLIAMGLLALFGLQGLISELLGVRIDAGGLSFPRRVNANLPFFAFWRRRVPAAEISRIDMAERGGMRLSLVSADVVDVPLPDSARARDVIRYARQLY